MEHALEHAENKRRRGRATGIAYALFGALLLRGEYSELSYGGGNNSLLLTLLVAVAMGVGAFLMHRHRLAARKMRSTLEWDDWGITESVGGVPIIAIPWSGAVTCVEDISKRRKVGRRRYATVRIGQVIQIRGAHATITVGCGEAGLAWMHARQCFLPPHVFADLRRRTSASDGPIEPDVRGLRRAYVPWLVWAGPALALSAVLLPSIPYMPGVLWAACRPLAYVAAALLYARAWPALRELFALERESRPFATARQLALTGGGEGTTWASAAGGEPIQLDLDGLPLRDAKLHEREGLYRVVSEPGRGGAFRGGAAHRLLAIESVAEAAARVRLRAAVSNEVFSRAVFASVVFWILLESTFAMY